MAFKEPGWGFWIPLADWQSAEYAAKMSGLPVFIMGLGFLVQSLILLVNSAYPLGLTMLAASIFFITSGLMIRKLKFKTLPISVSIWIALTAVTLIFAGLNPAMIINILLGLLAISGLRGWWWLKNNPATKAEDFD